MKVKVIVAGLVVAVAAVAGILVFMDRDTPLLRPGDKVLVARGAQIYAQNCASCHGDNLEGAPDWQTRRADGKLPAPPHDETGHTWHHGDQVLFDLTKYGLAAMLNEDYATDMPVYDGVLPDQDIVAVLSFIKSRWPAEVQSRHDQVNATAQKQ